MFKQTKIWFFCIIVISLLVSSSFSTSLANNVSFDEEDILEPIFNSTFQYIDISDIAKFVIEDELTYVLATSNDVNFTKMTPVSTYSFVELYPGQCIYNNELYTITQGVDALGIHATWDKMDALLKIGLINEENNTIYAVPVLRGNTTMLINTKNIPSGSYYVAVLNDSINTTSVFGAIAYSWEKH